MREAYSSAPVFACQSCCFPRVPFTHFSRVTNWTRCRARFIHWIARSGLSGPGRKYGDVCGEEFSAQARRERRAYPARGSVRSEQRRLGRKEPPPEGLRRIWPGASLLVGHSPTGGGCSLLAPRPRPNWAQQTSSNLRPGPLSGERRRLRANWRWNELRSEPTFFRRGTG